MLLLIDSCLLTVTMLWLIPLIGVIVLLSVAPSVSDLEPFSCWGSVLTANLAE